MLGDDSPRRHAMAQTHYNILLVDDSEVNRTLLKRFLEKRGYRVETAQDGTEALRAMHREVIDLVLLDIMMPGMSGLEVLQALRRLHTAQDLPIIMATSRDETEDMVEAFDLGASDYVTKPLDLRVVEARIQAQLRLRSPSVEEPAEAVSRSGEIGPGTVLAEKYFLEELIGRGNYGSVYRAMHLQLQRPVAVKLLRAGFETAESSLARLEREGISACRLQHPNAVMVLDFHTLPGGTAFLVMELLEGHALEEELDREGRLPPERALEVVIPVCEVLAEADTRGIIHRDVKPHNIFLHQTPKGEVVKVLDFGIAKLVGEAALSQNLTLEGTVAGTPAYIAPERVSSENYDGRADIYSLGVVLFELLAGRRPFVVGGGNALKLLAMHVYDPPPKLRRFAPDVSPELEAVVERLLSKDPEDRPRAAELARELTALAERVTAISDQPV